MRASRRALTRWMRIWLIRAADLETSAEKHAKKVDTIQQLCVILQKSIDDLAVGLHDLGNDVDAM